jgi:hypothetical protein
MKRRADAMHTREAIISFSQSEKIKAGIIWLSQALEMLSGLPEKNRRNAERVAHVFLSSMLRDVHLSARLSGDATWREAEKNIDMALVMLDSGVARESTYHITRALGSVTAIGQRAMTFLKDEGLM